MKIGQIRAKSGVFFEVRRLYGGEAGTRGDFQKIRKNRKIKKNSEDAKKIDSGL